MTYVRLQYDRTRRFLGAGNELADKLADAGRLI